LLLYNKVIQLYINKKLKKRKTAAKKYINQGLSSQARL